MGMDENKFSCRRNLLIICLLLVIREHFLMSGKRDSNPRPSAWEADALPTELLPHDDANIDISFFFSYLWGKNLTNYFYQWKN